MTRFYLLCFAINSFCVVMLGAFGAHLLQGRIEDALLQTWQTSVHYQMFHSVPLLAISWLSQSREPTSALIWSGRLFVAGLVLFCGSLYLLAATNIRTLGIITPFGGVCWLFAWGLLARVAITHTRN
jgi:uncharacterized membrane protein YgdD (TMEM256/DUF423 family)